MITKLQQRHDALLKKLAEQSAFINQKVDLWKFSYPELALCVETKKRTLEKTLDHVTQALKNPVDIEEVETLNKKLDDVESLFASLHQDFKPRWRKIIEAPALILLIVFLMRSFIFSIHCITSGASEPTLLIGDRILINKIAYQYSPIHRGDLISIDAPDIPYEQKWSHRYIWQRFFGFKFEPLDLPAGPIETIRRVVALPGDTIEGKIEDGIPTLYLNGDKLNEPYLNPYPLIASQPRNGMLESTHPAAKYLPPTFIKSASNQPSLWYTYIPNVSYEEQPFYKLKKEDIPLNPKTKLPFLKNPKTAEAKDLFKPIELPAGKYWCLGDNRRNSCDSRTWGLIDEELIRGRVHSVLYSIDTRESTWVSDILKDPVLFCSKKLRINRFLKKLINLNSR